MVKNLDTNYTSYLYKVTDIDIIDFKFDFNKYYSSINLFYNYIINDVKPSSFISSILTNILPKYKNSDVLTLNSFMKKILRTDMCLNGLFNSSLKEIFIDTNIYQLTDLYNFNTFYDQYIYNETDPTKLDDNNKKLLNDFANITNADYNDVNGGNKFKILDLSKVKPFVVNDYRGEFFYSALMNLNNENPTKNETILHMQNVLVSDKIMYSINDFINFNNNEKNNVITLYNNIPILCSYIMEIYHNGCANIDDLNNQLSTHPIESIIYQYYNIIMTKEEYELIFDKNELMYDFDNGSIGILIFNKIQNIRYTVDTFKQIFKFLDPTNETYEFQLYRKTDLPSEYKYIFNDMKNIEKIVIKHQIDKVFDLFYNQISIFGNNDILMESLITANTLLYLAEPNPILLPATILKQRTNEEIIKLLDLIEYYSDTYRIDHVTLAIYNIYNFMVTYQQQGEIRFRDILVRTANPVKLFTYLYYGSYISPDVFFMIKIDEMNEDNYPLDEINYSANLTILFYNYKNIGNENIYIQDLVKLYKNSYTIEFDDIIRRILAYIEYIEININHKSSTDNIAQKIRDATGIIDTYVLTEYDKPEQYNIITNDVMNYIQKQIDIISTMYEMVQYPSYEYLVNFIVALYLSNEEKRMSTNSVLPLMKQLWELKMVGYDEIYKAIMDRIRSVDPTHEIFQVIYDYVGHEYIPDDIEIIVVPIINPDINLHHQNISHSDEQSLILPYNMISILDNKIIINNQLISDSHKLIKIIKSTNNHYIFENTSESFDIYMINSVINTSKKIYINFPYKFVEYIDSLYINGILCKQQVDASIDETYYIVKYNPYEDTMIVNLPHIYPDSNITEIEFIDSEVQINKNYIMSDSVVIYLNTINSDTNIYLTDHYYLWDNKLIIKPKIVAIYDFKSTITLSSDIDSNDIDSNDINRIEFGLLNILSTMFENPRNILIHDTNISLYDIYERFNIYKFIDTTISSTLKKEILYKSFDDYGNNFYLNEEGNLSNIDYNHNILIDIIKHISSSTDNLLCSKFIMTNYSDNNYKFDILNLSDKSESILSLIDFLKSVIKASLQNGNAEEISNYILMDINHNNISDFISRPQIPTLAYIPYLADFIYDSIDMKIDGVSVDEIKDNYMYLYHNMLCDKTKRFSYYKTTRNDAFLLLGSQTKDSFNLFIEVPLYFSQISGLSYPLIASVHSKIELILKMKSLERLIIKNKFVDMDYKNIVKITAIYSVIYLDDFERQKFSNSRHEYLYQQKIYNPPIQPTSNNTYIDDNGNEIDQLYTRYHVQFNAPVIDLYYYIQLNSMRDANQYYNYTYNYLLPELNMTTRDKLIYLQQTMDIGQYDDKIEELYIKCKRLMIEKIKEKDIMILYTSSETTSFDKIVSTDNLMFLYNNLTLMDQNFIESYFDAYYESKLKENTLISSKLYLNSVERYKVSSEYSTKLVPYQSYNNMINGLYIYNFSLHPLEYQPSGAANFTTLKPELQITLTSDVFNLSLTDIYNSYVIGRNYNIMRFMSGIAGVAW
jgi:hypothetical protein